MPVYIFKGGSFYPLASQKVFIQHRWQELPKLARIYINSAWHYVGRVLQYPSVCGKSEFEHDAVSINPEPYSPPRTISLVSGGTIWAGSVSSGYTYAVSDGCVARQCECFSGGSLVVYSGGVASKCRNESGTLIVSSGGTAIGLSGGAYKTAYGRNIISSGGTSLDSWSAQITVLYGGTASRVSMGGLHPVYHNMDQGILTISGGFATDIDVGDCRYSPYDDGIVYSKQQIIFFDGNNTASATNITCSDGGRLIIDGPGHAGHINILPGGSVGIVAHAGVIDVIVSSGGTLFCGENSLATSVTVLSGGTAIAAGYGGRLENVTSHSGAVVG